MSSILYVHRLRPRLCIALAGVGLTLFWTGCNEAKPGAPAAVDNSTTQVASSSSTSPVTNVFSVQQATTNIAGTATAPAEDDVVALVTRGNELLEQGKLAEAAAKYTAALRTDSEDEAVHYNLAIALAKLGKTEEAKKHYLEALQIYPEYGEAHNNLGNLLMAEHRLSEAIEHFQEAIKATPDNASFHNSLGTAFGSSGRVAEAKEQFAEAVKLNPAYVEARVNLGTACLAGGEVDEAVTHLNEALRLKPGFTPAVRVLERARQKQLSKAAVR